MAHMSVKDRRTHQPLLPESDYVHHRNLRDHARSGLLVLSGYGVRVAVERGCLAVSDGIGKDRREARYSRATCGIKRLVVLGHSGTISFEALRWLADVGAAFVQIDADGEVIAATIPSGLDDARLRRAQAIAPFTDAGRELVVGMLKTKIEKQAALLAHHEAPSDVAKAVNSMADGLETARTRQEFLALEAAAAASYWVHWAATQVRFPRRELAALPAHWGTLGARTSPLTASPRKAATPGHALLNYLYALLEAETRLALLQVGLDPGMGILHADLRARDSLACDLMEIVRPDVDEYLLDLLALRVFSRRDFFETREGVCRVLPPLTHALAETSLRWATLIAPHAEALVKSLLQVQLPDALAIHDRGHERRALKTRGAQPPTPLTQANRRKSRQAVTASRVPVSQPVEQRCVVCGTTLTDAERQYCNACFRTRRAEIESAFAATGPEALEKLRAVGQDPAHGGSAGTQRGRKNAHHVAAAAAWRSEDDNEGLTPDHFTRQILPGLQFVSLVDLMAATGLSRRYCWLIKVGQRTPHPRHWATLSRIVSIDSRATV
jgi:CRISPR-associated endonuclease Cas1